MEDENEDEDEIATQGMRYIPAFTLGGDATPTQRVRNSVLYRRLKDGDPSDVSMRGASGLSGFVYDVPIQRLRLSPRGDSFSFRLEKDDECFYRLLNVICDHFESKCDADDEVDLLREKVARLERLLAEK